MNKKQAVWLGRFLTDLFPGFHCFHPRRADSIWIIEIWVTPNMFFVADSVHDAITQVIDVFSEDSRIEVRIPNGLEDAIC